MSAIEKRIAICLLVLWAVLFLPNLRTNPNWYGDEGEWMEKCWTFIHGTPRVGPVVNDFVFPYPYPPLYMALNGALLNVEYYRDPIFGFEVPKTCPGVPDSVLYPAEAWPSRDEYWKKYRQLAARYMDNFKKFAPDCPPEVIAAGPRLD